MKIIPWCLAICSLLLPVSAHAGDPGSNILKKAGILGNLDEETPDEVIVALRVPELGEDYEVKVNFLKVETSADLVDAFLDAEREEALKQGRDPGSLTWDLTREALKHVHSEARLEVLTPDGRRVGVVDDLGALTWGKTVKFTARLPEYKVRLRCTSGAGLYRMTFEFD